MFIHTCFAEKNNIRFGQNAAKNTRNPTYTGGKNGRSCMRLTESAAKISLLRFFMEKRVTLNVVKAIDHKTRVILLSFLARFVIEFAALTP